MAGWLGFLEAYTCLSSRETQWASRRAWVVWACWDLCLPDPAFPHAASPEGQVGFGPLDVGEAGRAVLSRTPSGPPAASPEGQVGLGPDWQRTCGQLDVGKAGGFSPAEPQGSP